MQAEGIKTGDRHDDYDDQGNVTGGWIATGDAVTVDGTVWIPVRHHDGEDDQVIARPGAQIDLSWGAGGDMQRTVKYPPGSPEYEAYAAELRAELAKFAAGEPPYDRPVEGYPGAARDAGFGH